MKETVSKLHEITPATPSNLINQHWIEEDSINLVDLWLELSKRKNIILTSVALALIAGLLIALALPTKYTYSTSLEIGNKLAHGNSGDGTKLIEQPETVLAKIQESYIPLAQQQYRQSHTGDKKFYKIEARTPKGSQLIVLQAKGSEEDAPAYLQHLQTVTDYVIKDHQRAMDIELGRLNAELTLAKIKLDELEDPRVSTVPRQELEKQLAQQQNKTIDLQDQAQLIKSRSARLDKTDKLLKKQISELEAQTNSALKRRGQAIGNVKNSATAMTMLLIDNEIQQNRTQLAALRERLQVKQQDLRQELAEQLASNSREQQLQEKVIAKVNSELNRFDINNQRAIARQKQAIVQIENQLNNFQDTRALAPPMRSLQPNGPGKSLVVVLALLLGLMIGVFAAFFAAFLERVKLTRQQ
jgi:LPS O-antigen subunit length determinant protein (WzzB/FepE family)